MTRRHGVVENSGGLVPYGHLGWGYRTRAQFLIAAAQYIADGLAHNQWVQYVGPGTREQLRAELDMTAGETSAVAVTPAVEFYGVDDLDEAVDPDTALDLRATDLGNALALGYSGVRVVADPTVLNASPRQRESFARLEFLIDQRMADAPITALCAYDVDRLDHQAGELICLHPLVGPESPTFHLCAADGADFALYGEIDAASAATFTTTLQRIWPVAGAESMVIDVDGVDFISHRELLTLDGYARRDGRRVVMRGSSPVVSRLVSLLDLSHVVLDVR